jgi:hypothetical protein
MNLRGNSAAGNKSSSCNVPASRDQSGEPIFRLEFHACWSADRFSPSSADGFAADSPCLREHTSETTPPHCRRSPAGLFPLSVQTLRGAFHRRRDPFVGADKPSEQKQNIDSDSDDDAEIQYKKKSAKIGHGRVGFDVTLTGCTAR